MDNDIVETAICHRCFRELSDSDQTRLKEICATLSSQLTHDLEFELIRITWTKENWFMAKLKEPKIRDWLTITNQD